MPSSPTSGHTLLNFNRSDYPIPPKTATVGMWIFLASLTMLFAATMLAYVIIRFTGAFSPSIGSVTLPWTLWLSTVVVLAASVTIQMAVNAVRSRKLQKFKFLIFLTVILGTAFCLIQLPALASLWTEHWQHASRKTEALAGASLSQVVIQQRDMPNQDRFTPVYGLVLVLIVVHAAHVLGGLVHLLIVTRGAILNHYDYEYYAPVKHAAMYWHFLDIVWLVMFFTMFFVG